MYHIPFSRCIGIIVEDGVQRFTRQGLWIFKKETASLGHTKDFANINSKSLLQNAEDLYKLKPDK